MEDVEFLRQENDRLTRELEVASHEKEQSASYGLLLLDERQALLKRVNELETLYETAKSDGEILKEVSCSTRVWYLAWFSPRRACLCRRRRFSRT